MFNPGKKYTKLAGDASSRRYWRVEGEAEILCHEPNKSTLNEFFEIASYLQQNNVAVPRVLSRNIEEGTYLQEDLGDTTLLLDIVGNQSTELEQYKKAIDELIKMQKLKNIPKFVANRFFDEEKYSFEVDMTLNYFGQKYLKSSNLSLNKTRAAFETIVKQLCAPSDECVFVHRDYHSRNIMVQGSELYIIDFQDARMGIPHYDLASLLDDCYFQISLNNKAELLNYYYEHAIKAKIIVGTFSDFMMKYNLMVVQRVFKAIGSFVYMYQEKSNDRYLKHIGFAVEKIRSILAVSKLGEDINLEIFKDYYAN